MQQVDSVGIEYTVLLGYGCVSVAISHLVLNTFGSFIFSSRWWRCLCVGQITWLLFGFNFTNELELRTLVVVVIPWNIRKTDKRIKKLKYSKLKNVNFNRTFAGNKIIIWNAKMCDVFLWVYMVHCQCLFITCIYPVCAGG